AGLVAAGQPIPPPLQARALVDTGSNVTAVAPWVLHQLAVPAASSTSNHTAGGIVKVKLYQVSVSIMDPSHPGSPMLTAPDLLLDTGEKCESEGMRLLRNRIGAS